jgi:hypothetical protein
MALPLKRARIMAVDLIIFDVSLMLPREIDYTNETYPTRKAKANLGYPY